MDVDSQSGGVWKHVTFSNRMKHPSPLVALLFQDWYSQVEIGDGEQDLSWKASESEESEEPQPSVCKKRKKQVKVTGGSLLRERSKPSTNLTHVFWEI